MGLAWLLPRFLIPYQKAQRGFFLLESLTNWPITCLWSYAKEKFR
jgi:hypothetical protein